MDVAMITQVIGSLGFPIAAACALFWYLNKEREQHKEEVDKMSDVLQSNTLALMELKTAIERMDKNDRS